VTPETFAVRFITRWEDGGSTDPAKTHSMIRADNGNWSGGVVGSGTLIGSNHGVTPAALAAYRKVTVNLITYDVMHALTVEEAASIALAKYYHGPGLDKLPWNQVTASLFDMGWGTGPTQAVKLYQRMVGASDDGKPGPGTAGAAKGYLLQHGLEAMAWHYAFIRARFYADITKGKPSNLAFLGGWLNRTVDFAPSSPWWGEFNA
jgi:lysozyme family protein